MNCRRSDLSKIDCLAHTHAGLWIDKFLRKQDNDGSKSDHFKEVQDKITLPEGYREAFNRRMEMLTFSANDDGRVCKAVPAETLGRMAVGLGQKGVVEAGMTLERTWGVPVIPGSSLKGIAAVAARSSVDVAWHKNGESYKALFGDNDEKGAVCFHDAWWKPEGTAKPLHLDIMTVHHPDYYQRTDDTPPSDMDSPIPIPFLSVTGKFEIMLEGPEAWVDAAFQLLKRGLKQHGIGAKTAGGYGRMHLDYQSIAEIVADVESKNLNIIKELLGSVEQLKRGTAANDVPNIMSKASPQFKKELALAIIRKLSRKWLKDRKDKPWVKEVMDAAEAE